MLRPTRLGRSVYTVILAALLIPFAASRPASADWLVYKDGTRLETADGWQLEGKLVVFSRPNGMLSTVRMEELDLDASRELTRSLRAMSSLPAQADPGAKESEAQRFLRVSAKPCLNRRSSPGMDRAAFDCVHHGTRVRMLEERGDWIRVATRDGRRGWMASKHLAAESANQRRKATIVITDADVGHVDPVRFERSSDAKPAPVAQKRGLVVTKWGRSEPDADGTLIVGALRNDSDHASTAVAITVRVLGHNDETLLEQPAALDATTLMPGKSTRFEARLRSVFSFRDLQFETSSIDLEVDG